MYVYSVIPLTKIPRPQPQIVSYFSAEDLARGTLVLAPLARRTVSAIIVEKLDARDAKQAIRNSPYALKKITRALSEHPVVPDAIIQEAVEVSHHYYEPLGLVLARALPSAFESPTRPFLKELNALSIRKKKPRKGLPQKILRVADTFGTRLSPADSFILISPNAPTSTPDDEIPLFSGSTTPKQRRQTWLATLMGTMPRIVGTRSAIFLPMPAPATIIIDGENNASLVSWDQHPKIDARTVALIRGNREGFNVVMRDVLPSINTWYTAKTQKWLVESEKQHLAPLSVIDMRAELARKNTSLLSPALVTALKNTKPNEKVFLFMHRRGVASAIVCRDCGFVVRCGTCELALVQHGTKLLCHHCGTVSNAPHRCGSCGGSRLKQLGGGTELIEREVRRIAPHLMVARIDSDATRTQQEQQEIFKQFREGTINVLVGTSMALRDWELPRLRWAAVVMMDGIANLPFYTASETAFGALWRLRLLTDEHVFAQTYLPELPLFTMAQGDSFEPFFQSQLTLRKVLGWPPFTSISQLVFAHKSEEVAKREAMAMKKKLDEQLTHLTPPDGVALLGPSPAMGKRERTTYRWYILIKWPRSEEGVMPELEKRNRLLSVVSPRWDITIDPIDIP